MESLRLAVNTQTPLVRFRDASLKDLKLTTGGVTRMLLPLLKEWLADGTVADAEWVALAADEGAADAVIEHDGVRLSFVGVPEPELAQYAQAKERMWEMLNSGPGLPPPEHDISDEAWAGFNAYQARSAVAMRVACERVGAPDLLYVHDFQQLGVAAAWDGPRVPAIFHLHTPYPSTLPNDWDRYFVERMRSHQAVIVSTRRYEENLRRAGLDVPIHVVRPFVDPREYPRPTRADVDAFRARYHVRDGDRVILNVGRMDPMKGQDRLVRALPAILKEVPDARLVLVGNGSFSNAKRGGLGLSKGEQWRAALEALARDLKVADRVVFTGHLGHELIPSAYEAAEVFCLPSTREGFGLAAIEAWLRERPVVVSDRAGVAELVERDRNGVAIDCSDPDALAAALVRVLRDRDAARAMGHAGATTARVATLPQGRRALEDIVDSVLADEAALAAGGVKARA